MTHAARIFGDNLARAERYHDLLATTGTTRGFIGPRETPKLWDRHILNCAVLGEAIATGLTVADIGSGAGLPGIPLAIARPDLTIYLVEPLLKRSTFLTEVVHELGLGNVTVIRGRAEEREVKAALGLVDVVTSRAVAPLGKLAGWSLPLVKPGGHMLAMKGASVYDELARDRGELRTAATIFTVGNDLPEPTTVIDIPKKR